MAKPRTVFAAFRTVFWQGQKESNPQPAVLETAALPIELRPRFFIIFSTLLFLAAFAMIFYLLHKIFTMRQR